MIMVHNSLVMQLRGFMQAKEDNARPNASVRQKKTVLVLENLSLSICLNK